MQFIVDVPLTKEVAGPRPARVTPIVNAAAGAAAGALFKKQHSATGDRFKILGVTRANTSDVSDATWHYLEVEISIDPFVF